MNDYDEAALFSDDYYGADICDACGDIVEETELRWDDTSECYVCPECLENPPDDL